MAQPTTSPADSFPEPRHILFTATGGWDVLADVPRPGPRRPVTTPS